jgi:hypothetical protein
MTESPLHNYGKGQTDIRTYKTTEFPPMSRVDRVACRVRSANFEGGRCRSSAAHLCCYERVWEAASERSYVRMVSTATGRITQHKELNAIPWPLYLQERHEIHLVQEFGRDAGTV